MFHLNFLNTCHLQNMMANRLHRYFFFCICLTVSSLLVAELVLAVFFCHRQHTSLCSRILWSLLDQRVPVGSLKSHQFAVSATSLCRLLRLLLLLSGLLRSPYALLNSGFSHRAKPVLVKIYFTQDDSFFCGMMFTDPGTESHQRNANQNFSFINTFCILNAKTSPNSVCVSLKTLADILISSQPTH